MTNPVLLASGIGMMTVGILPMVYWNRSRHVKAAPFVFGGVLWVAAIVPKIAIDATIGGQISSWASSALTGLGPLIFASLFVGLRTGAFESGFSYLAFLRTRLKSASFEEAVGFGLAFGGTEAILLGLGSFLNILLFLLYPSLVEQIPAGQREVVVAALDSPSAVVFAPIIERAFTILVHLFASVLVYAAALGRNQRFFWASFLYRAGLDGMVPGFSRLLAGSPNPVVTTYMIELVIVVYGLAGLLGVRRFRARTTRHD